MFIFLRILFVITVLSNTTFAMNGKNEEILDSDPTHRNRITISSKEENPSEEINISLNDIFPNELIVEVLSYLNAKELNNSLKVCKKWKDFIEDPFALSTDENKKRAAYLAYSYYKKVHNFFMKFFSIMALSKWEMGNSKASPAFEFDNSNHFLRLTLKYAIRGAPHLEEITPTKGKTFPFLWVPRVSSENVTFSKCMAHLAKAISSAPSCMNFLDEDKKLAKQFLNLINSNETDEENFKIYYPNHFSSHQKRIEWCHRLGLRISGASLVFSLATGSIWFMNYLIGEPWGLIVSSVAGYKLFDHIEFISKPSNRDHINDWPLNYIKLIETGIKIIKNSTDVVYTRWLNPYTCKEKTFHEF